MCFAQGHNPVMPVRLEPAAPLSRVKHCTTEPLSFFLKTDDVLNITNLQLTLGTDP